MDIVSRLKKFMDYTGLASSQFADTAMIPRPTLSQILNGRNKKISNELISKLHNAFPTLNILWLMFGDGQMTTDGTPRTATSKNLFEENVANNINDANDLSDELNFVPPIPALELSASNNSTAEEKKQNLTDLTSASFSSNSTDNEKKIAYIMVFFSDNSFKVFRNSN